MPPRKRAAPPPEEPSPASKRESVAQPSEPSKPSPDSEQPTISQTILAQLPTVEGQAYKLIFEAGNKGMWMHDIRNKLMVSPNIATKVVRNLVARHLLKEVSDVRHRSKKIFMATDFEPSAEITGGTWYHDGRLDTDAVSTARRCCQAQVESLGAATVQMIHPDILKDDPRAAVYTIDKIRDIVKTIALNKVTEALQGGMMKGRHRALAGYSNCYQDTSSSAIPTEAADGRTLKSLADAAEADASPPPNPEAKVHWNTQTDAAILSKYLNPFAMQAQNSPSMDISFDIKGYIGEEEVSSAHKKSEESTLSEATKDRLQLLMTHLNTNIADLIKDAGPIRDIFNSIKDELAAGLREVLQPAAYIECHEQKLLGAMKRLADRDAQKDLDNQEKQHKQSLVEFKDLIDKLRSAPGQINIKLEALKSERDQLWAKLAEINNSIKLEESNLARIPTTISEQRTLMAAKYAELKTVHAKKKQAIPGTRDEDNRQIAEIDAIRQNALEAVKSILNL